MNETSLLRSSPTIELRAATQLARLRQRQGQCADAASFSTNGWFTEEFYTPDLTAARQLLAEPAAGGA